MKKLIALFLSLVLTVVLCACGSSTTTSNTSQQKRLSESCDYVLCSGMDTSNNVYELVANQTESSLGFEITVGIIKNNEWLYPMSTDFPFLEEDNLFHIEDRSSGSDLSSFELIANKIFFIDSGAFFMEAYSTESRLWSYDEIMIFFSCSTLESCILNQRDYKLLYRYLDSDHEIIHTENGKILMYSEVSGTNSGWLEEQVFDWCLFDVQSLKIETFASDVAGIRPEGILSEGLFFASDQCFYDTKAQKVIDLSHYDIDMFYNGYTNYFDGGECAFIAENELGSEFLITIDTSGNILSEIKQ